MIPIPNIGLYLKLAAATLILGAVAWIILTIHTLRFQVASDRRSIVSLTIDRDQAMKAAANNDLLLHQTIVRAETAEKILAEAAKAAELRGETLTIVAREIDHASSTPFNCPSVPARFRAVARVLRDRGGTGDADQGRGRPATRDTGGRDEMPTVTVNPRR